MIETSKLLRRAGIGHHLLFACLLLLFVTGAVITGVVPTRRASYDTLFLADAGWRAISGQRPHVDFFCSYGAGIYALLGAGQWLGHGTLDGIGYFNALTGFVVGVWGYLLLRRAPSFVAISVGILLAILCMAQVSLGLGFSVTSHAMFYNRYCFAFVGLLLLECFPMADRYLPSTNTWWGGLSSGAICSILLFLKASYFLVAVVLTAVSLVWRGFQARRLAAIATGFLIVSLPFLFYIRFDLGAMIADLRYTAMSRGDRLSLFTIMNLFTQDIVELFILVGLGFVLGLERESTGRGWLWHWRFSLLSVVVYCAGILLMSTNAQSSRLPLDELLALLLAGRFLELAIESRFAPIQPVISLAALAIVALGIVIPNAATDGMAIANSVRLKLHYNPSYAHNIPISGFAPWIILDDYSHPSDPVSFGSNLVPYLTDGMDLLRQQLKPGETVATFDNYNPFPYLLQIPPPRGGMSATVYGYLFTEKIHLSADAYFGTADIVMYPKYSATTEWLFNGLNKVYGAALEERFQLAAESSQWKLYRRR